MFNINYCCLHYDYKDNAYKLNGMNYIKICTHQTVSK
jgi:hypothetical protein